MGLYNIRWSVKELAEMSRDRVLNRFDSNIAVTGGTGLGKSTFLWKFFHKFEDFKVEDKLTYSRTETISLIRDCKLSYCWNDELISSGNKRKFYDQEQIELIEILTKYRSNYNIVGGAIPIFFSLDKELLKLFGMHINIISRGVGVVHLPREGRMFSDDPWDVKINAKLEQKWSEKLQKNPNFKIPHHKYTTFAGYVYFGPMTTKQEKYYEDLRDRKKAEAEHRDTTKQEQKQNNFFVNLLDMVKQGKISDKELQTISIVNGKKYSSVKVRLNQMIKDSGEDATLKDFLVNEKKNSNTNKIHNNTVVEKISNIDV